jgi:hypothetical protein
MLEPSAAEPDCGIGRARSEGTVPCAAPVTAPGVVAATGGAAGFRVTIEANDPIELAGLWARSTALGGGGGAGGWARPISPTGAGGLSAGPKRAEPVTQRESVEISSVERRKPWSAST